MQSGAEPQFDGGTAPGTPTPPAATAPPSTRPEPRLGDLVAAGALYAALLFVVVLLTEGGLEEGPDLEPRAFFWFQLVDDTILTAVALLFGYFRFPRSWAALGLRAPRRGWWAAGAAGGALAAATAWALTAGLDRLGWPVPSHPVEAVLAGSHGFADTVLILVAVTVVVPIGEEAFFRGYAYRLLRARLGVGAAIGVTTVLFALVHGFGVAAWVPLVPVGVVFGLLVERSGSLGPAIVGHAVVNGLAVLLG